MYKQGFIVALFVAALASSASSQPATKEQSLKQLTTMVANLKQNAPLPREQAYLKLMSYRPLPTDLVPVLAKMIAAEKGDTRTIAAAVLVEITPQDVSLVQPLKEGVSTKDAATATAALKALEKMGPLAKPALPNVLAALEKGTPAVKNAAIPVFAAMGKEAVAPLEQILLKSVEARKKNDQAAAALGKVGPDATPTVLRLLDSDDPELEYLAAVALKSMAKKPPEALKSMLRLAQHKDAKVRRPAFEYLVDVPPTPATEAMFWKGLNDFDPVIMNHSFKALRAHEKDKKKMAQAMKTVLLRPTSSGGNIALLTELFQYDRKEAEALVLPMALQILSFQQQRKPQVIHLSTLEKELVPHLPKIYEFLDRPEKGNAQVRINVNILLNHLSPEHTKPVVSKMQNDLKSTRWELKLFAAQAILRTGPKDKAPLARALAETMTTPKLPTDFPLEEILTSLRALGPDGIAAVPSLRVAQTSARADNRARILLTMAALDPSTKDQAIGIGQKLYQTAEDKYAGAILLCELGVLPTDETLKSIEPFLTQAPMKTPALRLTQTLGAKAKPLIPILEAKLAEPRQLYPAPIAATLGRIDGNTKQMLDRLVQIARDDPKQLSNVTIECGRLGAAARPVVPALVEIHQKHRGGPDFFEALALIDPQALNRLKD